MHILTNKYVKNAMKRLAWTHRKQYIFDKTKAERFENELEWTGSNTLFFITAFAISDLMF